MFLPIREGLMVALREMQLLKESMKRNDCYIEHFECILGTRWYTPRKRLREPTVSPEVRAAKKPV